MTTDAPVTESELFALRQKLADELQGKGFFITPAVESAFRVVPRHLFVPNVSVAKAYSNSWIGTKQLDSGEWVSSSSSPDIMAVMLEQLALEPGQRVLEIGAGTGYNAALMAYIVGAQGQITSIDIDEDVASGARDHLAAAGVTNVTVVCADGGQGFPEGAPYDCIILTVGAGDIAPAWREQLRLGGRLVMPLWLERDGTLQACVAFIKQADVLESVSVKRGGFMGLRGAIAISPRQPALLGPEPGLEFGRDDNGPVDAEGIYRLLTGPYRDFATDVMVTARDLMAGLYLWLLPAYETHGCGLQATGVWLERGIVPNLIATAGKFCSSGGLMDGSERCALMMRPPDQAPSEAIQWNEPPFNLYIRSYGSDDSLAERFMTLIRAWDGAGRPSFEHVSIEAYPDDVATRVAADKFVLPRRFARFVIGGLTEAPAQ